MVDRLASSAWWVRVLAVYAATRALTFLLFLLAAANQGDNYWTRANPDYFDFLNIWDVEWYEKIYSNGYPVALPLSDSGEVQQNEWAFMPGFPTAVHAFDFLGLEWKFAAPILATLFGACFALVAFRIFAAKLSDHQAIWSVGLFLLSPAAPVLQTGYAESMGLLLLALAILAWISDRFWLTALAMLALAFTRPGLAALALALAVVWVYRFVRARMGQRGFPAVEAVRLGLLSLIALGLNFAWPLVAALVTGRPDAYVATELAWRTGYPFEGGGIAPILPWFSSAEYFVGGLAGQVLVVLALVGAVVVFFIPQVRALGLELGAVAAAYFVYLLLFFFPQSSIVRILMPTFVLFGALAQVWVRWPKFARYGGLAGLIVLQFAWLMTCWRYAAPDFSST